MVEFLTGDWSGLSRDEVVRAIGRFHFVSLHLQSSALMLMLIVIDHQHLGAKLSATCCSTLYRYFPDQRRLHGSQERSMAFPQLLVPLPQLPGQQQVGHFFWENPKQDLFRFFVSPTGRVVVRAQKEIKEGEEVCTSFIKMYP